MFTLPSRGLRAAQPAWHELGVRRRIAILREFQHLLHRGSRKSPTLITREAGKPLVEALLTEVLVVLDATRFCVENAFDFLREQPVPARQPGNEDQGGTHSARAAWRDRNYFAVELSVFHSGHGIVVRARHRKCGGAEAIGTYVAHGVETCFVTPRSRCSGQTFFKLSSATEPQARRS